MAMDDVGEDAFTMVTQELLFSPRRIPQGVLNATLNLQSTMEKDELKVLVGVICKVRVNGRGVKGHTPEELLGNFVLVLVGEAIVCDRSHFSRVL